MSKSCLKKLTIVRTVAVLLMTIMGIRSARSENVLPDANEIVRHMIEASKSPPDPASEYAYSRSTLVLFFDEAGQVKKQTERLYQVTPVEGKPVMKLLMVNGKPVRPNPAERKNQYSEAGDNARKLEFSEDLAEHYDFTTERVEIFEGRKTFVLNFKPKSNPPDTEGFFAKLLNELTGHIWVDAEEYQLARAEIRLLNKVSFLGGLAGAIEKLDLKVARQRVAPSVWFNRNTRVDLEGRKLLTHTRLRAFENCSNFQPLKKPVETASR